MEKITCFGLSYTCVYLFLKKKLNFHRVLNAGAHIQHHYQQLII